MKPQHYDRSNEKTKEVDTAFSKHKKFAVGLKALTMACAVPPALAAFEEIGDLPNAREEFRESLRKRSLARNPYRQGRGLSALLQRQYDDLYNSDLEKQNQEVFVGAYLHNNDDAFSDATALSFGLDLRRRNPDIPDEAVLLLISKVKLELDRQLEESHATGGPFEPVVEIDALGDAVGYLPPATAAIKYLNKRLADLNNLAFGGVVVANDRANAQQSYVDQTESKLAHGATKALEEVYQYCRNNPAQCKSIDTAAKAFSHQNLSPLDSIEELLNKDTEYRDQKMTQYFSAEAVNRLNDLQGALTHLREEQGSLKEDLKNRGDEILTEVGETREDVHDEAVELKKQLREVEQQIKEKTEEIGKLLISEFSGHMKDVKDGLTDSKEKLKGILSAEQKKDEARRTRMTYETIQSGVNTMGALAVSFVGDSPQQVRDIRNVQNVLSKGLVFAQSVHALSDTQQNQEIAAAAVSLNYVALGMAVAGALTESGPSPEAIMMKELQAIRKAIFELHKEVHEMREEMHEMHNEQLQKQFYYFFETQETFSDLFEVIGDLQLGQEEILAELGYLNHKLDQFREETLAGIQEILRSIEESERNRGEFFWTQVYDAVEAGDPLSRDLHLQYSSGTYNYAENASRSTLFTGVVSDRVKSFKDVYEHFESGSPITENFLLQAVSDLYHIELSPAGYESMPNPQHWNEWATLFYNLQSGDPSKMNSPIRRHSEDIDQTAGEIGEARSRLLESHTFLEKEKNREGKKKGKAKYEIVEKDRTLIEKVAIDHERYLKALDDAVVAANDHAHKRKIRPGRHQLYVPANIKSGEEVFPMPKQVKNLVDPSLHSVSFLMKDENVNYGKQVMSWNLELGWGEHRLVKRDATLVEGFDVSHVGYATVTEDKRRLTITVTANNSDGRVVSLVLRPKKWFMVGQEIEMNFGEPRFTLWPGLEEGLYNVNHWREVKQRKDQVNAQFKGTDTVAALKWLQHHKTDDYQDAPKEKFKNTGHEEHKNGLPKVRRYVKKERGKRSKLLREDLADYMTLLARGEENKFQPQILSRGEQSAIKGAFKNYAGSGLLLEHLTRLALPELTSDAAALQSVKQISDQEEFIVEDKKELMNQLQKDARNRHKLFREVVFPLLEKVRDRGDDVDQRYPDLKQVREAQKRLEKAHLVEELFETVSHSISESLLH